MAEPAVSATDVNKNFPGGVRALQDVHLACGLGEICALIGANGSGKTTLLKIIAGLLAPDRGTVRTLGYEPFSGFRRLSNRLAYIPQQLALDPEMTGWETLRLFGTLYGLPNQDIEKRSAALAEAFDLTTAANRRVSGYSGGMQRRLHLAIGLLHQPLLLLLDEPTSGLDPEGRSLLWSLLQAETHRGAAIIVITHDLLEATERCHRVALLHEGQLLLHDSPQQIIDQHSCVTVEVGLTLLPENPLALQQRLGALDVVQHVELRDQQLILRCEHSDELPGQILKQLEAAGERVVAYRLEQPNLASAYAGLTGKPLSDVADAKRKGRRK